jgi:hypothetical protein
MRAITPSIPQFVCPRQGRRRPMPGFYAAGEVTEFALGAVYGLKWLFFAHGRAAGGPRRGLRRRRWWRGVTAVKTSIGGGAPVAKLSASDPNSSKVNRREEQSRPAAHLLSCSSPAATGSRRCRPWRAAISTWPKHIFRDHSRPLPARFARCPQASAPPVFPLSRVKLPHGIPYVYPIPPELYLPRAPRFQDSSSREIVNIQAGQCGN